jgi:hypothetical protein
MCQHHPFSFPCSAKTITLWRIKFSRNHAAAQRISDTRSVAASPRELYWKAFCYIRDVKIFGPILILIIIASSCLYREKHPFSLAFEKDITLDSIPSASGISIVKDSAYIIGDDGSSIYKLSLQTHQFRKISLPDIRPGTYRVPKDLKKDFESTVTGTINNHTYLLAFGSGTLYPHRDTLLLMDIGDENIRRISLSAFYNQLIQQSKLDRKDFNIEGAAISGNHLYLFNRADGIIFQVNWMEFFQYIDYDATSPSIPPAAMHTIYLPEQGGVKAGFSGACTLDDETILFTASLENTKNWVDDGEIMGSYVGVLDVTAQNITLNTGLLLRKGSEVPKVKLESLDIVSSSKDSIIIESVADNDDGTSAIYRLRLLKE